MAAIDEGTPEQPGWGATALAAVAAFALVGLFVQIGRLSAVKEEAARAAAAAKPRKPAAKTEIKVIADASAIPASERDIPNSLGYLGGADDGLTPEEREAIAKENAEEERLAAEEERLAAEAAAAREKEAAAAPPAALVQGPVTGADFDGARAGTGAAAAAAAAPKPAKPMPGVTASRLNGGSGMASGVTRKFDTSPLPSAKTSP